MRRWRRDGGATLEEPNKRRPRVNWLVAANWQFVRALIASRLIVLLVNVLPASILVKLFI